MKRAYQTKTVNPHGLEEERQWARILTTGDPVKGMVVLMVQKMCAAYHEFEPAWRAGALIAGELPFFRERLAMRVERVLDVMRLNGLTELDGAGELQRLADATRAAESMDVLADLAEEIHAANHVVTDALERA
jgi:hypothetical protein